MLGKYDLLRQKLKECSVAGNLFEIAWALVNLLVFELQHSWLS